MTDPQSEYEALSALLWRERDLLDLLLFKAEEKQYLIVQNKTRWLARIAREIEIILEQVSTLEVERAAHNEELAATLGLPPNPSLKEVAAAAPDPWAELLQEHYVALLGLVTEIRALSSANRSLIETGLSALGETLIAARGPSAGTYTAKGRTDDRDHRAITLDGTL